MQCSSTKNWGKYEKPTDSRSEETSRDQDCLQQTASQHSSAPQNWCHNVLAVWWHGASASWWWRWRWWPAGGPAVTEGSGGGGGGLRRPSAMGHPWAPPSNQPSGQRVWGQTFASGEKYSWQLSEKYCWQNLTNTVVRINEILLTELENTVVRIREMQLRDSKKYSDGRQCNPANESGDKHWGLEESVNDRTNREESRRNWELFLFLKLWLLR